MTMLQKLKELETAVFILQNEAYEMLRKEAANGFECRDEFNDFRRRIKNMLMSVNSPFLKKKIEDLLMNLEG